MRKKVVSLDSSKPRTSAQVEWLALENIATVEISSEDPDFQIESALTGREDLGWRAAETGEQLIRIVFDHARPVHRIRLVFFETENQRTQEFTLRWSEDGRTFKEIVRQQWTFSPRGSTSEIEDYAVELDRVSVLELAIKPDLNPSNALATLGIWRIA